MKKSGDQDVDQGDKRLDHGSHQALLKSACAYCGSRIMTIVGVVEIDLPEVWSKRTPARKVPARERSMCRDA